MQFLKHLSRTRLLLHLIDVAPVDGSDPGQNYKLIEQEVVRYSDGIAQKNRWLVFTKLDVLSDELADDIISEALTSIEYDGPVFRVSALLGRGTEELIHAVQAYLREQNTIESDESKQAERNDQIRQEVHDFSSAQRKIRRDRRQKMVEEGRDDDFDVDVHYEP